ncbi:MAG: hypothetical protein Ct9H300mP14_03960 [Gammaproteobacteria bacterium]|nr:MAG: hypothetical protein Ct9H300mP14_03960 [Gammaproteobacteria bacterium]
MKKIWLDPALAGINSQTRAVPLPDVLSPATAQSELRTKTKIIAEHWRQLRPDVWHWARDTGSDV